MKLQIMKVIKRDGRREEVSFDKVLRRLKLLCSGKHKNNRKFAEPLEIDITSISQKVINEIKDAITTTELDEYAATICASMTMEHPDYAILAGRIIISNHQKNTLSSYADTIKFLYQNVDHDGNPSPLISHRAYKSVLDHKTEIELMLDYDRDFKINWFGFKTLERSYLLKTKNGHFKVQERPQHMYMRVAIGLHGHQMEKVRETYDLLSLHKLSHASPTLYNAGTPVSQMSSCFLSQIPDSLDGIFETLKKMALISKVAGGIGLGISDVRAKGSMIKSNNGQSDGLIPMLKVYNEMTRYVNQCFAPDTSVYSQRGVIKMDDVREGDELVSMGGGLTRVNEVIRTKVDKKILEVKVKYSFKAIRVTKEHEIYVIKNRYKYNNYTIWEELNGGRIEPEFISGGEIRVGDLVGYPIPSYVQDDREYTYDLLRFYGLLMSCGASNHNKYGLILNKTNHGTYRFIKSYLVNVEYKEDLYENMITFIFNKDVISLPSLYDKNNERQIDPRILFLPEWKIIGLLQGLMEDNWSLSFDSKCERLVYNIRYIFLRLGVLIRVVIDEEISPRYRLMVTQSSKLASIMELDKLDYMDGFTYGNIIWCPITQVNEIAYEGEVIDLNMEADHNYLTDMGLVHNSGKRKGSIAVYIEPHHADVQSVLDMRKNHGKEELRCRDLFSAIWMSDLFMTRLESAILSNDRSVMWSLFCPNEAPGLTDVYGDEYAKLYKKYENNKVYRRQIPILNLWDNILSSQKETGTPYIAYKDCINSRNPQKNVGIIKNANLCCEICLVNDPKDETISVCNLAAILLPAYVKDGDIDYSEIGNTVRVGIENLNRVIDLNYYPVEDCRKSNMRDRPVGMAVIGLHDVFLKLKLPYESDQAKEINFKIFETIYYHAVRTSMELSKRDGPYETFKGSPASEGKLQIDLWNEDRERFGKTGVELTDRYDWDSLRADVKQYGLRNSTLTTIVPSASTSNIVGLIESMEPITYNVYTRRVLSCDYKIVNSYMQRDLLERGLWTKEIRDKIMRDRGSIQNIDEIPKELKKLYKGAFEVKMKKYIDLAVDRSPFIDLMQSLNIFVKNPTDSIMTSIHMYGWKNRLKTGMYYLRREPIAQAIQFTLRPEIKSKSNTNEGKEEGEMRSDICRRDDPTCAACQV